MPRQLQGSEASAGLMTAVAPLVKGGTGATTPAGAVQNLGGISRSTLGKPNGLLPADHRGYLPAGVLKDAGFTVGYALEGPSYLVHGLTSVFYITNYSSLSPADVSVDVGSVVVSESEIYLTAPSAGSSVTMHVGERTLTLPLVPPGPFSPELLYPQPNAEVKQTITVYAKPFHAEPDVYGAWVEVVDQDGVNVAIPAGVSGIECLGRRGNAGEAYVTLQGVAYQLGVSTTRRKLDRGYNSSASFFINGTGKLSYRWIYPSAKHIATDWEIARDAEFTDVVLRSLNDAVNLTSWLVTIEPGQYFVRTRYYGDTNL